ncbi:MAG: DUF3997 domain-containing protein [Flavobacteriales bacterium]|nr:DUF3997 domain-containing protein [Flavobacteriales bacterium]MCB9446787.1 DUF3997 domain-containing protein [Flavobacteriales bacterium]
MKANGVLLFMVFACALMACCISAKEDFLGNNMYLSEYNNVDRRILYQKESCATTGTQIVPMTVLEIAHDAHWIIAKSGNKRQQNDYKYWVIKNNYDSIPDAKTVEENTIEFDSYDLFIAYLKDNRIHLELERLE